MRLLQEAAPESGLWRPRMSTPPYRHRATQPAIQELETTAGGGGHLSIKGQQTLQAMLWVLAYIGAITHSPSLNSWKENRGEDPAKSHGDITPREVPSSLD